MLCLEDARQDAMHDVRPLKFPNALLTLPDRVAQIGPCSDAAAFYIHRREHDESQHEGKAADQNRQAMIAIR